MSDREYGMFLQDMLDSLEKIIRYCNGKSFDEFKSNDLIVDGVVRNLEIIGEAAKKIPEETKQQYPFIEWKKIAGLMDILIHEYFGIDYDVLWDIVRNKAPGLIKDIKAILG